MSSHNKGDLFWNVRRLNCTSRNCSKQNTHDAHHWAAHQVLLLTGDDFYATWVLACCGRCRHHIMQYMYRWFRYGLCSSCPGKHQEQILELMNDGITMVPEISIKTSLGTLPIQAVLIHLKKVLVVLFLHTMRNRSANSSSRLTILHRYRTINALAIGLKNAQRQDIISV